MLVGQIVLPLFLFIPAKDLPELFVQLSVAQKVTTLFDESGGIDVVLSKKINELEKLVVDIAVVESTLDPVKELRLVVVWYHRPCWLVRRRRWLVVAGSSGRVGSCDDVLGVV